MVRRILIGTLVAGSLSATIGAVPAAVALPRAQSTTCSADLIVNFRPGLNLSERSQTIKMSGSLSGCVGGGVTSAMGKGTGSGTLSCTSGVATATVSLRWNTLETSKLSISVDVSTGAVTGTVVSGKFAGEEVTASLTLTPLQGDCFFSPVTKAEATGSVSL
jgi:hypothetical protein